MNDKDIKKIIEDTYDDSREDTYFSWTRSVFKSCHSWVILLVFVHFFFFLALAIVNGVLFFITSQTKYQIMYAALFVVFILIAYLIKIFGWIMAGRNSIKREVKRLEFRIAELSEAVKEK
jgi:uncharacterized protein YqhQ